MNEKQKDRLAKVKAYVVDKAPEIITATAAVTLTTVTIMALKQYRHNQVLMQQAVEWCRENGRDYTLHPGVGLYLNDIVTPKK